MSLCVVSPNSVTRISSSVSRALDRRTEKSGVKKPGRKLRPCAAYTGFVKLGSLKIYVVVSRLSFWDLHGSPGDHL